jgi:outer membrane protein OmpA-like peptidoglycan-associated protein/uncharacterized protein YidB (DUF937 family)
MALMDALIPEAASRFGVASSTVNEVVKNLLGLITDEKEGGISGFAQQFREAGLGEVFNSWVSGSANPRAVSELQLERALGGDRLSRLATHAGVPRTVAGSIAASVLPRIIGLISPGGVLPSNSAALAKIRAFLEPSPSDEPILRTKAPEVRESKWLLWLVGLLGVLGALWLFSTRPSPGTIDARLSVANEGGRVVATGRVRDEDTRRAIVNSLYAAFGAASVSDSIEVDPRVKNVDWLRQFPEIAAALKAPGAEFSLEGARVEVGGWLSGVEREDLERRLRGLLGGGFSFSSARDKASAAVEAANQKALAALSALRPDSSAREVIEALNLAVINFPSGSAEVPAGAKPIISRGAAALKGAQAGVKIEIGGHTDNTGDPAANLALSKARAAAVRDALVSEGVSAGMLEVEGYGETKPVADNATPLGRFRNRRIAYTLVGQSTAGAE